MLELHAIKFLREKGYVCLTPEEREKVARRVRAGFGCSTTSLQPGDEAERDYYEALALLSPEAPDE